MVDKVRCRVFGYCTSLLLHGISLSLIARAFSQPQTEEVDAIFAKHLTYATIWNIGFQIGYAILGLICDVPVLMKVEEGKSNFRNFLRWYRSVFLSGVLWPCGLLIYIVFWPIFLWDRELIYPAVIDSALGLLSNHLMHSIILPIVVWEIIFAETRIRKAEKLTITHWACISLVYTILQFYTFFKKGVWSYPMLAKVYLTIYQPILYLYLLMLCIGSYCVQFYIPDVLKSNENVQKSD